MRNIFTVTSCLTVLICLLFITVFQGCSSKRTTETFANGQQIYIDEMPEIEKEQARKEISLAVNDALYRYELHSGDSIEVMYHIDSAIESEDYLLNVNDEIQVDILHHDEITRRLKIRPDGKITLPRKGDMLAVGLKPMELSALIENIYSDIFTNLTVTTTVTKYTSKMQELKKAITNSPLGQAKAIKVNPDGYIQLPLIDEIKASKLTISELESSVNKLYQKQFRNFAVSMILKDIVGNTIFVFGEVQQPGAFNAVRPMTLLQAVGRVGGIKSTGSLKEVKVLYWDKQNRSHIRTVNLYNILDKMQLEEDILLANNSVIFVPKTGISLANEFVDQYISKLLLFNGTSFGISYEIDKVKFDY